MINTHVLKLQKCKTNQNSTMFTMKYVPTSLFLQFSHPVLKELLVRLLLQLLKFMAILL